MRAVSKRSSVVALSVLYAGGRYIYINVCRLQRARPPWLNNSKEILCEVRCLDLMEYSAARRAYFRYIYPQNTCKSASNIICTRKRGREDTINAIDILKNIFVVVFLNICGGATNSACETRNKRQTDKHIMRAANEKSRQYVYNMD